MPDSFSKFVTDRSMPLDTVDPEAGLDDLEPLADTFRAARVVAIGENAHCVREFYLFRHRLLRFLVERCGFTVFAMESGFSEGLAVDAWVGGGPGELQEIADHGITYTMGRCPEMRDHLRWMREANTASTTPVRFFGLDVPGSTASPLPAIRNVGRYLRRVDAEAGQAVDRLVALIEKYAGEHALPAYAAYGQLDRADRNELTVLLAELAARFDALEPDYCQLSGVEAYQVVRHELRLAGLLDQAVRANAARMAGETAHPKVAARDRGMAETVFWLLDRFGPDAKIVLGAHNSHLQRTPVSTPAFELSAAGHHLASRLGDDYLAVAVTCAGGRTATHRADPEAPGGVRIVGADLAPPGEGSVEATFPAESGPRVVDLRGARGRLAGPERIRIMDGYQEAPVLDAYDLVVNLPEISPTSQVTG